MKSGKDLQVEQLPNPIQFWVKDFSSEAPAYITEIQDLLMQGVDQFHYVVEFKDGKVFDIMTYNRALDLATKEVDISLMKERGGAYKADAARTEEARGIAEEKGVGSFLAVDGKENSVDEEWSAFLIDAGNHKRTSSRSI